MKTPEKYYTGGYLIRNITDGKEVKVHTVTAASAVISEVSKMTLLRYIRMGGVQKVSTTNFLIKRADCTTPWEEFNESRSYKAKGPRVTLANSPVKCWDVRLETIKRYANPGAAVAALGLPRGVVYQSLKLGKEPNAIGLVNSRWIFRFEGDPFPDNLDSRYDSSARRVVPKQLLLKVIPYGLVVPYHSLTDCSKATGIAMKDLKIALRSESQTTPVPHYLVKSFFDETPWLV